jgi:uroporphyrinogen-III synthase
VTRFLEVAGRELVPPVVACIGPVTAGTAREHGLTVDVEAAEHTIDGLVAALAARLGQRPT